jgi:phosphatidylglycerol---prolipoprotein diacylglyceryl transferase
MSYPYLSDVVRDLAGVSLPLPIPTFGLLVATAILVAIALLTRELMRLHEAGRIHLAIPKDNTLKQTANEIASGTGMSVVLVGLIGARLFHILEYPRDFIADPLAMIFTRSGFTIYGGMLLGTVGGWLYLKRKRLPLLAVLDAAAPAIMLAYAIGRIGCQISGDGDWGIAANMDAKPTWIPMWLWAQTYENNVAGVMINPPGVYPTPIYETVMALICFAVLWQLRKHSFRNGWLISLFLLLYGIERFLVELIRVNTHINLFGVTFTQAQLLSVLFVIAGMVGMIVFGKRKVVSQ